MGVYPKITTRRTSANDGRTSANDGIEGSGPDRAGFLRLSCREHRIGALSRTARGNRAVQAPTSFTAVVRL